MSRIVAICVLALGLPGGFAIAAPTQPATAPVRFQGDHLQAFRDRGLVKLEGNVEVEHADTKIWADRVELHYAAPGGTVERIVADGNVRMQQQDRRARAARAIYQPQTRRLELTGEPVLWEAQDRLRGERIVVYREPDRAEVFGAEALIAPERIRQAVAATTPATTAERSTP